MDQSSFLQSLVSAWDEPESGGGDPYVDETSSPPLSSLVRAVRMFVDDRVTPQALFEEIRLVTVLLEQAVRRHPEAEGLEGVRRGLLLLAGWFQDREDSRIEEAVEELKAAAASLEAAGLQLEEDPAGQDLRPHCLVCGQVLDSEAPSCDRCGAQAPTAPVNPADELSAVPAEVIELAGAGEQVVSGAAELEHWQALVLNLQDVVARARQQVAEALDTLAEQASPALMDLGDSMVASLDEALSVLNLMAIWDGTQARVHRQWAALAPALARARKAGELFWENAAVVAPI